MKYYSIFGFQDQIENVLEQVQLALGVKLTSHESSYRGVYYRCGVKGEEHFELQPNFLKAEGEWFREAYREYPVLLLVNESTHPDKIAVALKGHIPSIRLLKQEEL